MNEGNGSDGNESGVGDEPKIMEMEVVKVME